MTTANDQAGAPPPAAPPATPEASAPKSNVPPSAAPGDIADALKEVAGSLLAEVPEHLKALIPDGLDDAGKIKWFQKAKAAGAFGGAKAPAAVPETDSGKPPVTPRSEDLSKLPVYARMATGYRAAPKS